MAIKMFRESGLSQNKWCKQNGIGISTLTRWLQKDKTSNKHKNCSSKKTGQNQSSFIEVKCKPEYKALANNITIKINESEIIIPTDVPIVVIEAIVKVVKSV